MILLIYCFIVRPKKEIMLCQHVLTATRAVQLGSVSLHALGAFKQAPHSQGSERGLDSPLYL